MAKRYSSVAISLHWLIAVLLAGLVVVAKVMNSLSDDDPLRFTLIQWHKSFGIMVLLLVVARVLWRVTHRPPKLPAAMKGWEKLASAGAHVALYLLMLAIPLSGWMMVSASPLNLKTELFGAISWPHLPYLTTLTDKQLWAERLVMSHHWLANGLLVLVILHVAAALRHQFVLKDNLMARMVISAEHKSRNDLNHGLLFGVIIAVAGGLYLAEQSQQQSIVEPAAVGDTAGRSRVTFEASQLGDPLTGVFADAAITFRIDTASPGASSLTASVLTGSVSTGDGQIDATVVTADWFASTEFPEAVFQSRIIESIDDSTFQVTGDLTIRDISREVVFNLVVADNVASGNLLIDRTQFNVGVGGQDEFVAPEVKISFQTPVVSP